MRYIILLGIIFLIVYEVNSLSYNDQCTQNSDCDQNQKLKCIYKIGQIYQNSKKYCLCTRDAYYDKDVCRVNAGGVCSETFDCTFNSNCYKQKCTCNANYHIYETKDSPDSRYSYLKEKKIICSPNHGEMCDKINNICDNNVQLMECTQMGNLSTCQCRNGAIWSEKRQKCAILAESYPNCKFDDDCIENAYCNHQCKCLPDFISITSYQYKCDLKIAKFGEVCTNNSNINYSIKCQKNFICNENICQCPQGSEYSKYSKNSNNECIIKYAENCEKFSNENDPQCETSTYCAGEICLCDAGFSYSSLKKKCIELVLAYCQYDSECRSEKGTFCNEEGKCTCKPEYFQVDGSPICRIKANGDCTENLNCIDNSKCTGGICKCDPGFEINNETLFCDSLTNNYILKPLENSGCSKNKGLELVGIIHRQECRCRSGWEWNNYKAKCSPRIFSSCQGTFGPNNPCPTFAFCNSYEICECFPDFVPSNNRKNCLKGYLVSCEQKENECNSDIGLECLNGVCDCIYPGEIFDYKLEKCALTHGEKCERNSNKCISNAHCLGNVCVCNKGYIESLQDESCIES